MLQQSTQSSGITAGHDTPYKFLTMGLPLFAPLRDQGLRCLLEGATGAPSPFVSSPCRAASSLPFGRELPALSSLRSGALGRVLFAFAVAFAVSLRFLARS